jgi:hypothetical protein
MLLVYVHKRTERVAYALDLVLGLLAGFEVDITTDEDAWLSHPGPKLRYAPQQAGNAPWIAPNGLLTERGIREQDIRVFPFGETVAFFATDEGALLPFDPFAAAFYLATRYEEYQPFIRDEHNRFTAAQSVALKHNFLHRPVVEHWAIALRDALLKHYPTLDWRKREFTFRPTYDIDMAWSYLHKGLVRTIGGYLNGMVRFNLRDIFYRTATLLWLRPDPYYTYDYLKQLQERFALDPVYFFLVGNYDRFDKNISLAEPGFQQLIRHVADYATVGIHPSYGSNRAPAKVKAEKDSLEDLIRRPVRHSRQHYLMLRLPDTYQTLLDLDITDDYTLGYTSHAGFRAGLCTPYQWYDLRQERKTQLTLHPFALMDSVYRYYNPFRPEEVADAARPIIDAVKEVNGTLYTLWHNNSFSEVFEWRGWRKPYEEILEYITG